MPAAFLLHPRVRQHGTESDVRAILQKRKLGLKDSVNVGAFVKLAERIQRKGKQSGDDASRPTKFQTPLPAQLTPWLTPLEALLESPLWTNCPRPARVSEHVLVGAAEHATDVALLRGLGIKAVVNLAPHACEDPVDMYDDNEIAYQEWDAEDFEVAAPR